MSLGIVELDAGRVIFSCTPGEEHYTTLGTVHGGYACSVLDTVARCAAQTLLEAGAGCTSIEIAFKYHRMITAGQGSLVAVGRVVKRGRRVIFAEGRLAIAQATCSLLLRVRCC